MCELCVFKTEIKVYFLTDDRAAMLLNSPPIPTGAPDPGGDGGSSHASLLGAAVPEPGGGALLHRRAPRHHRPLAGRLGTQAGTSGEAVGEELIDRFSRKVKTPEWKHIT